MKQRKCKRGRFGFCFDYGNCDDCEINQMIARYEKKLRKQKELNKCALRMFKDFSEVNSALLSYRQNFMLQGAQEFAEILKEKFGEYEVWHYDGEDEAWHDLKEEIDEALEEYRKR